MNDDYASKDYTVELLYPEGIVMTWERFATEEEALAAEILLKLEPWWKASPTLSRVTKLITGWSE